MQEHTWDGAVAIASDETGRLFVVARANEHDPAAHLHVLVADAFPGALQGGGGDASDAAVPLRGLAVRQVVSTSPPIDFDVTAAAASADGHQLLLAGTAREDVAAPVLALVDLYGSEPLLQQQQQPAAAATAAASASGEGRFAGAKRRRAALLHVHASLYSRRPGLRLLQVAWHPRSAPHFAALASDNRWRLYHSGQLAEAEQTFWLRPAAAAAAAAPGGLGQQQQHRRRSGGGGVVGLRGGGGGRGAPPRVTAFAFGPPRAGWASLAVLFLCADGGVYALCPVAPFGMRVAASMLERLLAESSGTTHAWLLAAFLSVLAHESDAPAARPHLLETAAPALQGPLNAGSESLHNAAAAAAGRSVACTIAVTATGGAGAGGGGSSSGFGGLSLGDHHQHQQQQQSASGGGGFAVLATGFSSGTVYAHALDARVLAPAWHDALPQCVFDRRGEVAAVRYEVDALPVAPAIDIVGGGGGLLASVDEGGDDEGGGGGDAGGGGLVSPLLLLDALKVNLHLPLEQQQQQLEDGGGDDDDGDGDGGGDFMSGATLRRRRARLRAADSDEESDAGYDPAGEEGGGGGAAGGRRGRRLGAALFAEDDDSEDDDGDSSDDDDEALALLRRVTLHAAPELPGRLWVVHDQGAWGVNVRWLPALAARLEAAEAAAAGRGSSARGGGAGPLPPPALQELLVSSASVAGSCVVGNALLGSGCVVLEGAAARGGGEASTATATLTFLRPRPAAVIGEPGAAAAAAAAAAAGDASADMDAAIADADALLLLGGDDGTGGGGGGGGGSSHDDAAARARMEEFYADIVRGPRRLPPPPRPAGPLAAADPEGVRYLHAATTWLLGTHVRFAAGAHADLLGRLQQLHQEAGEQRCAARALRELADAAAARQAELAARLARLAGVAAGLAERSALLAGLHWGVPRPPSAAERQLERQLELYEQRRDQLRATWLALRARLDAYAQQATTGAAAHQQHKQQQRRLGVPALLAAGRGGGVPVTAPPSGPAGAAQLDKLRAALATQNGAIADARARLEALEGDLAAWRRDHPEAALPGRLRHAAGAAAAAM